ncbi:MAG: hypothetical protein HY425_03465 [Candidatus Levybacteria bacterium]|nr:hypothetical protein [Candidatus Levybacteria bacterium]
MDDIEQPRPDLTVSVELQDRLARINNRPVRDMVYVDEYDLREISSRAYRVGEADKAKVRPVLKRVMLGSVPWARGAKYVREQLYDLAYSPQEISLLSEEAQRASQRRVEIGKEVADGTSPWLVHIHHNEQGISNPYMVGVYQDEAGQLQLVYGQRNFRSQRQIESTIFAGRTEVKEVNLLDTQFQAVRSAEVLKGENWNLLPDDLRSHFDRGEILVTGGNDVYDLSNSEVDAIVRTENPRALLTHIDSKTQQVAAGERKYFLLYYSDYRSDETGRTGVVMVGEGGKIKPLTIQRGDKQFAVEVKGCGTKSGGFGKMHFRTGRDIITGGAEKEQAENEFNRLQDDEGPDAPKPIGSILFSNNGYDQGYIIRLTPSTVRAAYSDNEIYPQIESPEMVERIVPMYAYQLAEHIYSPTPKVLDRSSHTENLLIWGNGKFAFTDYSDHVAFVDKHYPHEENHGGYMTPKQMLKYYIEMVREMPGYVADRNRVLFYDSLNNAFQDKGVSLGIEVTDEPEQVIQKVWERAMAYEVFKARKAGKYVAEGVLQEQHDLVTDSFSVKDLSMESAGAFDERLRTAQSDIADAINLLKSKGLGQEEGARLDAWLEQLNQRNLYDAVTQLDNVYSLYRDVDSLTDDERTSVYRAISYFGSFHYVLISPFEKYFEHEQDVIKSARIGVPESEQEDLNIAEQELTQKTQQFRDLINGQTSILLETINDPQRIKDHVLFKFYGH